MKNNVVNTFKNAVSKYMDYFSLKMWEVTYSIVDDVLVRATTQSDLENKIVLFSIDSNWIADNPTTEEIKLVAFHEVMEVLFNPISVKLWNTYSDSVVANDIHSIIVLFENVVFPLIK